MDRESLEDHLIDLLRQFDENPEQRVLGDEAVLDDQALMELKSAEKCLGYLGQVRDLCKRESVPLDRDSTFRSDDSQRNHLEASLPRSIGRFEVLEILGAGGFGNVYLALDPKLDRHVALKVPNPDSLASAEARNRFRREAHAAAILSHPNIVAVYESGEIGPLQFIAYKYCPGLTLSQWLKSHDLTQRPEIAAKIAKQIAEAVQHAHQKGVIHRDLKPSNILLESVDDANVQTEQLPEQLRISDFGLAKLIDDRTSLTRAEAVIGTPAYMSPEQAEGNKVVDELSDVYAIGAILYELVTGHPPHRKDTIAATLRAITDEQPGQPVTTNPLVSKELNAICLRCIEKVPGNRYLSAHALAEDLDAMLDNRPISISHPGLFQHIEKWCRRNKHLTMVLAASTVFSLIVSIAAIFWINQARQSAENAKYELQQSSLETKLQAGYAQRLLARQLGFAANSRNALEESTKAIAILKPLSEATGNPDHQAEYLASLVDRIEILIQSGDIAAALTTANLTNAYLEQFPRLSDRGLDAARLVYYSAWCNEILENSKTAENQFQQVVEMLRDSRYPDDSAKDDLVTRTNNHLLYLRQMSADDGVGLEKLQANLKAVVDFVKRNRAIFYYFEDESIAYQSLAEHHAGNSEWSLAIRNLQWAISRMQRVENTTGTQLPFRHKRIGKMYHQLAICLESTGNPKLALDYLHRGITHTRHALQELANDVVVRQTMSNHIVDLIRLEEESRVKSLISELAKEIPHFSTDAEKLLQTMDTHQ